MRCHSGEKKEKGKKGSPLLPWNKGAVFHACGFTVDRSCCRAWPLAQTQMLPVKPLVCDGEDLAGMFGRSGRSKLNKI